MTITEKVAYVKGLIQGLNLDEQKPEVKVLLKVVDLLDELSLSVSELEDAYDDVVDQMDAIDEDLCMLEEDFYDKAEEDDDDVFYEVTCPTCNETVCVSEPVILDGQIECPGCGEKLEFDFDDICNCDDECECGSDCECEDGYVCNDGCTCVQ